MNIDKNLKVVVITSSTGLENKVYLAYNINHARTIARNELATLSKQLQKGFAKVAVANMIDMDMSLMFKISASDSCGCFDGKVDIECNVINISSSKKCFAPDKYKIINIHSVDGIIEENHWSNYRPLYSNDLDGITSRINNLINDVKEYLGYDKKNTKIISTSLGMNSGKLEYIIKDDSGEDHLVTDEFRVVKLTDE